MNKNFDKDEDKQQKYAVHLFYVPETGVTNEIRKIIVEGNKYAKEELLIPGKWHWAMVGFNNLMEAGGFMLFYVADNSKLMTLRNFAKVRYKEGRIKLKDIKDSIYPPFKGIVWYVGGEFSIGCFDSYGEFLETADIFLSAENISKATLGLQSFLPLQFQGQRIERYQNGGK